MKPPFHHHHHHHQWRYSLESGLGLPYGFRDSQVYYDVGYQPHDQPVLVSLIQPPETSNGEATIDI
jgi:hypothetical protein